MERPLHRDSDKSPSSTRTDPAHPTCSYTKMQGNRLQSPCPTALGIRIYCMERPHRQEHQAPRRHPKQCSTICTLHYDWNTSVTALKQDLNWPTLLQRCKTQDPIMWYKIHFGIVHINFPSVVLPRPRNSQDRLYHELSYIQVQHRVACFGHILCRNHFSLELPPCITSQRYFAELLPASGSDPPWVAPTITPPYPLHLVFF